jgi:phage baseplate assembly protein V
MIRPGDMRGIMIGVVHAVGRDDNAGSVKLRFPWLEASYVSDWVSFAQDGAGPDRGVFFMPEENDEVVVAFLNGEISRPFVIGATYNPRNPAPSADPRQRMLRSKNGHTIRFVDSTESGGDRGALIIEDGHGNRITMSNGYMKIEATGVLELSAPQIVLSGPGWTRPVVQYSQPV